MPKKRRRENPLTEHIADFADMEYDEDSTHSYIIKNISKKRDEEYFDDSDKTWMYNDYQNDTEEDNLYNEEDDLYDNSKNKIEENLESELNNPVISNDIDKYMSAAVWFNEINKRGFMSKNEQRYVELMIIELAKFYFANIKDISPSKNCMMAIQEIYNSIKEANICQES